MVKLIMTDIDGTLIPDGTMDINPEYFEVIEKLVEKGIIFVCPDGKTSWYWDHKVHSTGVGKRDVETIFKTERSRRRS